MSAKMRFRLYFVILFVILLLPLVTPHQDVTIINFKTNQITLPLRHKEFVEISLVPYYLTILFIVICAILIASFVKLGGLFTGGVKASLYVSLVSFVSFPYWRGIEYGDSGVNTLPLISKLKLLSADIIIPVSNGLSKYATTKVYLLGFYIIIICIFSVSREILNDYRKQDDFHRR